MQNVIELSAAVIELSCVQRKKTPTKTIQSVATARTVIINNLTVYRNVLLSRGVRCWYLLSNEFLVVYFTK